MFLKQSDSFVVPELIRNVLPPDLAAFQYTDINFKK